MLTTQDKHNPGCQRVAGLEGQSSTGYDWERVIKVSLQNSQVIMNATWGIELT